MWFWLGSRGEENGLFPFLTSFFSCRQRSGQDPRGGSRRCLKDKLDLLRADLKGGREGGGGGRGGFWPPRRAPAVCLCAAGVWELRVSTAGRKRRCHGDENHSNGKSRADSGVAGEPGLIRKRQSRAVVEPPPPHPRTHYVSLPHILSVQGLPPSIPIHDLAPLPAHP